MLYTCIGKSGKGTSIRDIERQGILLNLGTIVLIDQPDNLNPILDNIIQYIRLHSTRRMDITEKYGRSFAGKVALVTGGSRGIGKGIVRRLASDGAAVAFTYSRSEEEAKRLASEIEATGGNVLPIKADSASAEDVRAAFDQVAKELGELDIFVNNAGILIRGSVDSYSLEDFDRMLAINVRAAFVGIQAASEHMKGGGRIILIGSNTAVRTAFPGASVYSMTKAALTGLVRGVAIDLAPRAITVNNVQPGPTATDMSAPHAEAVKTLIPLGRMADVSEIAGLVSYLASNEAGFITGASLTIDGGYIA